MRALRALLGTAGVAMILVGAWYLFVIGSRVPSRIVGIAGWLAGGVVAHDAVVAPLVLLVGVLALPRLPSWSRAPVAGGLVVLLSVTLLAFPVIGRFGAREDVPSLLDRPYGALWLLFAGIVVGVVVLASLWRRHRSRRVAA